MAFVSSIARPMLSAIFIAGGVNQLRDPESQAKRVEPVTDLVTRSVPRAPRDTATLVRINGATQVGAGVLLAVGRLPRLSALGLASSLIPTTAGAHRFWEEQDAAKRADQQMHFLKNAGLFGGLLLAAVVGKGRKASKASKATGKGGNSKGSKPSKSGRQDKGRGSGKAGRLASR